MNPTQSNDNASVDNASVDNVPVNSILNDGIAYRYLIISISSSSDNDI